MTAGDTELRTDLAHNISQPFLVCGIDIAVQKTDGDSVISLRLKRRTNNRRRGRAVHCPHNAAIRRHALVDLEGVAPGHHGCRFRVMQIVNRGFVVPLEEQNIPRALGGEKADLGTLSLQHRIGRDGRAMDQVGDRRMLDMGANNRV